MSRVKRRCPCHADCRWLTLLRHLEMWHDMFGKEFHRVKDRLLRHPAPIKHQENMGHADSLILFNPIETALWITEDRHGIDLLRL